MRRNRSWRFTVMLVVLGVASVSLHVVDAADAASTGSRLQLNLSRNGSGRAIGEPEIAVDPTNSNRLFLAWTTFLIPLKIGVAAKRPCGGMVSTDEGRHWKDVQVPINDLPYSLGCADAAVAAGPDGTLYAAGIDATYAAFATGGHVTGGQSIVVHGRDVITRSTDWGNTWSEPVVTTGSDARRFVSSGAPLDTFDRPWVVVDQSDGTVYASAANLMNHERYVTASTNRAKSFGRVYPIDSDRYPQDSSAFLSTIAAAHGLLAVVYRAASASGNACPCLIFETSRNHGKSFHRHVVPLSDSETVPSPYLSANPRRSGEFAFAVLDASKSKNQVYVTSDAGETWRGPALVGEEPTNERFKPWLAFTPTGRLALVWRTRYADGAYDVWAAVGRVDDQKGAVFSAPLRVSGRPGAYPNGYIGGDDFSWIVAGGKYVHVGWGDSRTGKTQCWYGRIPLSSFRM